MYSHLLTPSAPFQVELSARPVEVDYTPARGLGYFFVFFGAVFSAFSLLALTEQGGWIKYLIAGGILFIGGMVFRLGLRVLFAKRIVRFEDEGVVVTERGFFGERVLRERYDAFKGVAARSFQISRKNSPTRYFQAVELQHEDAEAIALLVTEDKEEPREALEVYARVLGVPTIRDGEVRMPEDLDKSLVERVGADAYVGADWTEPPKGLKIETRDNRLAVTLPPMMTKVFFAIAAVFLAPLIFVVSGTGIPIWLAILMGLLMLAPMFAFAWLDRAKPRRIEITRDKISFSPGIIKTAGMRATTLPLESIEEVTVNAVRGLSIVGDGGSIVTGPGLSKDMQEWLKHYVKAAIVTA